MLLSCVWLLVIPWTAAHQASLSFTGSWSLLRLMSIELVMLSNHLILYCPLLLPSIFPNVRDFSNESALHIRCPKYCSFNLSISPSKEYWGLISFRIDWFNLAVQGILKRLLQHHSVKSKILQCSNFFLSNTQILNDDTVKVLHVTCQQIWKTQQWPQDWKGSIFISIT